MLQEVRGESTLNGSRGQGMLHSSISEFELGFKGYIEFEYTKRETCFKEGTNCTNSQTQ